MAIICRACFFKCSTGLIFRIFNTTLSQNCLKFSTSKVLGKKNISPIKYTTHNVSKMEITDVLGFRKKEDEAAYRIRKIILGVSFLCFLVYFCILREENDIDDILRGGEDGTLNVPELMKLKIDLKYCESMKLPTDKIKARIDELERDKKYVSPFIK